MVRVVTGGSWVALVAGGVVSVGIVRAIPMGSFLAVSGRGGMEE